MLFIDRHDTKAPPSLDAQLVEVRLGLHRVMD